VLLIAVFIMQCKPFLIPVYSAVLLSILLLPLANWLEKLGLPKSAAALIAVLAALLVVGSIVYMLSSQIIAFLNDIPAIRKHLAEHYENLLQWTENRFNISERQQKSLINTATAGMEDSAIVYIRQTVFTLTETIVFIIFTLIYTFLLLFYRHTIRSFLFALFARSHKRNVDAVINGSQQVIKNYMQGLVMEMAIISASNTLLLLIIGVKYAVFLGVFTGILNILPYIGIYMGMLFTVLVTLTTDASTGQMTWIIIGFLVIHFIDANFLMPRIVGSKVKINALITILGAVAGGFLIGIAGVFFALPTIAILKIIFDRTEEMKPWGILLGDESEPPAKKIVQRIGSKLVKKK
jgi:predicted PurR-regulated permease PerM